MARVANGLDEPYVRGLMHSRWLFVMLALPARLAAQCPDGSPPPCRTAAPTVTRTAPDSNRIVILPFRVTSADTMLGEGLAELLATEFTGESGPRAVHMGSVLREWHRAGGGPRTPLSQPDQVRVATALGAGMLIDGSVVGLGPRLTLSATVTRVPGGISRAVAPVSSPPDSLPQLVERLVAGLLAATAPGRSGLPSRLSDSPVAIREYVAGMREFRSGKIEEAASAFERSFAADSLFARAAFMRWLVATWGEGGQVATQWRDRTRSLQHRLSGADQVVLSAAFGTIDEKERAAMALPESPEVQYFLGDNYFHNARAGGWVTSMARARVAFERSLALDTQATVLQHLLQIGLLTADTPLIRTVWPAFNRIVGGSAVMGWEVAARIGDARLLDSLRRSGADTLGQVVMDGPFFGFPATLVDEAAQRTARVAPPPFAPVFRLLDFSRLALEGRPAAAARLATQPTEAYSLVAGLTPDIWLAASAALGDGDPALGAAAANRLRVSSSPDSGIAARARCAVLLWDTQVSDSTWTDDGFLGRNGQASCAETLRVLARLRSGTLDSAGLARSDSIIHLHAVLFPYSHLGEAVLARAWERLGLYPRAMSNARYGSTLFPSYSAAMLRRSEGRLAALMGDTVGAIRAYREYLDLRRDAEPSLVPQRDSVIVELNRLLPARGRSVP